MSSKKNISGAKASSSVPSAASAAGSNAKGRNARRRQRNRNGNQGSPNGSVAVAYSHPQVGGAPTITRFNGGCRIAHRELVDESIVNSTTFAVQSVLELNPGLATTFPWLAPQAAQWEQYCCKRLVAQYIPFAPTSTQGDVIMSPEYDASDTVPTTEAQAANVQGSLTDACWKQLNMTLDPTAMMGIGPRKFVRSANVAGDPKTFDVGRLFICTNNGANTNAIGKVFLDYEFEFYIPQNSPESYTAARSLSLYSLHADQAFATGVIETVAWDSVIVDGIRFGTPSGAGVFTPPAGVYELAAQIGAADTADEDFNCLVEFYKNGALVVDSAAMSSADAFYLSTPLTHVVTFNGTDTLEVKVTMTGAAGNLTAVGTRNRLLVKLA
jgi:hypothetical protein